jgi:hypothetical protein
MKKGKRKYHTEYPGFSMCCAQISRRFFKNEKKENAVL